ncbi:MAG: hypothetical protein HY788_17730 [Deltaproteobacteria bacterium]|nr:hypothetical protein [Deltaproteobacteria bacterium]
MPFQQAVPSTQHMGSFDLFRQTLSDFSRRVEAIRESPEDSYLLNTEMVYRLLGVLENLGHLTERNHTVLEMLLQKNGPSHLSEHPLTDKERHQQALTLPNSPHRLAPENLSVSEAWATNLDQDKTGKKRRAREVLGVLENKGAITYEDLRNQLTPVITYNRVTALVSEMIRDGIPLTREGKPVKVSLEKV